jgi:hypothetical protein
MPNTVGAVVLPYPVQDGTSADNVPVDLKNLADAVAAQVPALIVGTRAANVAGTPRRFLLEGASLYVDDGASWLLLNSRDADTLDGLDSSFFAGATATANALAGKLDVGIVDAKADLIVGIGPDAAGRLPVGSQRGQQLVTDPTAATGLTWRRSRYRRTFMMMGA